MILIDFRAIIEEIGAEAIFNLMNTARPPSRHLFAQVFPEITFPDYDASSANMTIRSTMAKAVAMDSKYPEGGIVTTGSWAQKIAKIAHQQTFPEQMLRELRKLVTYLRARNIADHQTILREVYNFVQKLLIQPIQDTSEWLRGQALTTGAINWQSDDILLDVTYDIPAANFLTQRTSNDKYSGTTSKFWEDYRLIQEKLNYQVTLLATHMTLALDIVNNPANNLNMISQDFVNGRFSFRKMVEGPDGIFRPSEDSRDTVITLITYNDEAEVIVSPTETKVVQFMPSNVLMGIGSANRNLWTIGTGGTPQFQTPVTLGYTHVGPTEEGNGQMGPWQRLYVPEAMPMTFRGQAVKNLLPVFNSGAEDRVVIASSDLIA